MVPSARQGIPNARRGMEAPCYTRRLMILILSLLRCLFHVLAAGGEAFPVLFRQYDKDKSGKIDELELKELAKAVNNANPLFPGNFAKAMSECDA